MSAIAETSDPEPSAPRAPAAPPADAPALILASRDEAAGAVMTVAGLTVIERAVRQLAYRGSTEIVIANDGTVEVPASVRARVDVREVEAATPDRVEAIRRELGEPLIVVRADVVRPAPRAAGGGTRVVDEASRQAAEDAVFAELLRGDLGMVARHVNKPVSFWITRHLLCPRPWTPNQVTLAAGAVGLLGCLLIAMGSYAAVVLGFLLAQAQSILDGCDGELARVRFQQSPRGEWLDTLVDDVLNAALVVAIGVGLSRRGGSEHDLVLALIAAAMLITYNVVAYRQLHQQGEGGEVLKVRWWFMRGRDMKALTGKASSGATAVMLALGRRDLFVFAWLALAVVDQLWLALTWAFLVAFAYFVAAVGQLIVPRMKKA